jgi:hypothetical protein
MIRVDETIQQQANNSLEKAPRLKRYERKYRGADRAAEEDPPIHHW